MAYSVPKPRAIPVPVPAIAEQTAEWVVNAKAMLLDVCRVRLQNAEKPAAWVTLDQVRTSLPKDGVLVEVLKILPYDLSGDGSDASCWAKDCKYAVWVIPAPGEGEVQVFDLDFAKPIDEEVNAFLAAVDNVQQIHGDGPSLHEQRVLQKILDRLSALVLESKPERGATLASALKGKSRWIISGDSLLGAIPWAALRRDSKYVLEDHAIEYVNSGRDLVLGKRQQASGRPVVVAFPNYNLSTEDARLRRAKLPPTAGLLGAVTRIESLHLGKKFDLITPDQKLLDAMRVGLERYVDKTPNEFCGADAVKAIVATFGNPQAIVFITHGWVDPAMKNPVDDGWSKLLSRPGDGTDVDPFSHCLLALAGANSRVEGKTNPLDDGLLLGSDIARLGLHGTELVFLATCVANRGEVRNGEGLASLSHAFQVAGAQSVIATQWSVPTEETIELTRLFWDGIRQGQSHADALRQAQLKTLERCRADPQYHSGHPWYWCAFTCTTIGKRQ